MFLALRKTSFTIFIYLNYHDQNTILHFVSESLSTPTKQPTRLSRPEESECRMKLPSLTVGASKWYELRGARASLWSSSAVFVAGLFCTTVLTINFAWGEKWQSYLGINGLRLGYWLPIGDRLIMMILITYISDMNGRIGISHFYSPFSIGSNGTFLLGNYFEN